MKNKLIVLQEGNKDCGAACLLSIIRFFGGDISLDRIKEEKYQFIQNYFSNIRISYSTFFDTRYNRFKII